MSNGVASKAALTKSLQDTGAAIADPFEVSTIRREDYKAHKGTTDYEDVLQVQAKSVSPSRGHQGAAAFLSKTASY